MIPTGPLNLASMRPQHITAENERTRGQMATSAIASMRPQHITAENSFDVNSPSMSRPASMRPQHITAENRRWTWWRH